MTLTVESVYTEATLYLQCCCTSMYINNNIFSYFLISFPDGV
jgi:hypothetical protein